jgi:hypothetical protein
MGFREKRRPEGVALKHRASGTLFLFRPYEDKDFLQPAEIFLVTKQLDDRGLLDPESLENLLTSAPA